MWKWHECLRNVSVPFLSPSLTEGPAEATLTCLKSWRLTAASKNCFIGLERCCTKLSSQKVTGSPWREMKNSRASAQTQKEPVSVKRHRRVTEKVRAQNQTQGASAGPESNRPFGITAAFQAHRNTLPPPAPRLASLHHSCPFKDRLGS